MARLVIDQWHTWTPDTYSGEIWLGSGYHQVVVDYYEAYGLAFISMWWERVNPNYFPDWKGKYYSTTVTWTAIPRTSGMTPRSTSTGAPARRHRASATPTTR